VRIVFFVLLFLNLAYFAWAHWVDAPRPAPVNEAIAHLPQLKMADELAPAERPAPRGSQKTTLSDTTSCVSVGPFLDLASSAQAATLLKAKGFDPRQRAEQGQVSFGYWVYVAGLGSQADADRALVTLERNGIKDALVMPETADGGRRLSLGLYSERSRAERRAQALRQAGLSAEISERKLPGTLYWVDLTPPPGMSTTPLQGLFADGANSRIAVQPCLPAAAAPPTTAATGPAAGAPEPATAHNPR
jgi:SPOR domain